MPQAASRRVIFQPATCRRLQRGVNKIVEAIRPTLGPRPRVVAVNRLLEAKMPEMLDNGGTIARRIERLADPDEDMGAQLVRDMLWRLQDQVGDGTATAAVLFGAVYNEGLRTLAAGGNAMRLHDYLGKGLRLVMDRLSGMTVQVSGKEELARIARSLSHDPALSRLLGEILDIVGAYGRLEIREGRGRDLEREYVEGMYWEWGLFSRDMIADLSRYRTEFEDAAILISDLEIDEPQQLYPALEMALRARISRLVIVAGKLSDRALGFLLANRQPDRFQVIAVKTPGWDANQQAAALQDMAILTGGRPFIKAAGETLARIAPEHLGRARRVSADLRTFGIVGGKSDPRRLRQHIAHLRSAFDQSDDTVQREALLKRVGMLLGGSATLWIGAATKLEIAARKELAERTAASVRAAMMEGVVPGGGTALLACRPALDEAGARAESADERGAYRILSKALAVPFRTIVSNAGYDAGEIAAEVRLAGPGFGFDVAGGQVVDVIQAGISDPAIVVKSAVYGAVSAAALALTVDVLIHRTEQPEHAQVHIPSKRKKL